MTLAPREQKLFEQAYDALTRKPFNPFTLVLNDGRRYDIANRDFMAMARGNSRVVVLVEEGTATDFFDWQDVASVEEPTATAAGS